ncbi:hypothetical protein C8F04DRAFT_1324694 [Mycena alexandri]|uniref:Rhodopsin domain-containing protein n=1 Tax=Mycena alexandri TaxID=1745969 RepID=A0AAD6WS57_9AGAR|nr:hypothetical protein C8F04DRAFT_1324694 [Mycena alexandri]
MPATIEQLRIVLGVVLPFACLVTYFRLYVRYRRGKLWWDDFWVFICTLCAITFVAASLLHVQNPGTLKQNVKVSVYYMCAQFFYAVVWTARISILFTVIRLSFGRMRRLLFWVAIAFFGTWGILFAQVWWVCERQPGWKAMATPQCALGLDVAIAQLITDVLSDLILIAAPMHLLWRVQLQRGLKLRLRAVFATTSIGTAVSLYHAYCVLRFGGIPEFLAATIQVLSVSLLVANLAVIVAVVFRLKTDSETDNIEPLSVVTIGSARARPKNLGLSTLGAMTTQMDDTTKINVHIVHTNDRWTKSTPTGVDDEGVNKFVVNDGPDRLELKVLSAQHGFIQ